MGSGKSHWGKIWATESGMDFFDLDAIIEEKEKMSIDQIFEKKGEDYFRLRESEELATFAHISNGIIACGGGTPCFHNNINKINEMGFSVYLKGTPNQLLKNLLPENGKRPLLKMANPAEKLFFIEQKLAERASYYDQAKMILLLADLTDSSLHTIINSTSTCKKDF